MQKDTNFYNCLKWIYKLLFWTGVLSLNNNSDKLIIGLSYNLYANTIRSLLLCGFVGSFTLKLSDETSSAAMLDHLTPVTKFILAFECLSSTITYMLVFIGMDLRKHKHVEFSHNLKELDSQLLQDFPFVTWNYYKTERKYTPLTIGICVFYSTVSLIYIFIVANCSCDFFNSLTIAITYACITVSPGLFSFLHVGYMDLLRIRFRLIATLSNQLVCQHQANMQSNVNFFKQLCTILDYFKSYTQLILEVNSIFGFVTVACIFYDFAVMTNMVFLLCQKATEPDTTAKEFVFIACLILPRVYKIIMTAIYGYLTDKEKKRTIHSIMLYIEQYEMTTKQKTDLLEQFVNWNLLNKYDFTVGNIIRCNLNLIFMVLNAIANYVIVLIQLQLQQNTVKYQNK